MKQLITGLIIGFGIGGWIFYSPQPKTDAKPSESKTSSHSSSHSSAESGTSPSASGSHGATSDPSGSAGTAEASVQVDPAVLSALSLTTQPSLEHRAILFSDGDLVAQALAITEKEKNKLEQQWTNIKKQILHLQHENLHYEQGENLLWLGASPFDGSEIQQSLQDAALEVLGKERGKAFLEMTRANDAFGGWGARTSAAYSIQIEQQSDDTLVYRITERAAPDAPAGRTWISNKIPPHIREMTDVLGIDPTAKDSGADEASE